MVTVVKAGTFDFRTETSVTVKDRSVLNHELGCSFR